MEINSVELFNAIGEQAVKAAGSRTMESPEPDHIYLIQSPDGKVEERRAQPCPRAHEVRDLASALAFAGNGSSVWYNISRVVCLIDDSDRRDRVTLNLPMSKQLTKLIQLQDRRAIKQAEFVKMLRIDFAGCLAGVPNLIGILSKVQFKVGSSTEATLAIGKSSIGKQIESEVRGVSAIPEVVGLDVPMFSGIFPQMRCVIDCAIEPDAGTETFQLIPLPSEIDDAIRETEDRIGKLIHDEVTEVPIYFGNP